MPIRVVIVRQGGNDFLQDWWEEETDPSLTEVRWEESARLWPEGLLNGFPAQPEVFICLDRESVDEDYETVFLGKTLNQALASMWGAKLYVVVDRKVYVDMEEERKLIDVRREWFDLLLKKGTYDVLELKASQIKPFLLRQAAIRARERLERLTRHIPSGKWNCLLHWKPAVPEYARLFLEGFLVDTLPQIPNNCLIVLRDNPASRIDFVRQAFKKKPPGKLMVGWLDELVEVNGHRAPEVIGNTEPQRQLERPRLGLSKQLPALKQLCEEHDSPLIAFHDLFELHYFLQKLNNVYDQHKEILQYAEIVRVREPHFSRHAPQLLITHSFYPGDHGGCLAAAGDAHTLCLELGDKFEVVTHPAMQNKGFRDTLKELTQLLAWVHIGHGDYERGLQQADGLFKSAEEWIGCFAGHDKSLSLAVFCSCRSDDVAEKFAKAGVGVTIGFKKDVRKNLCGQMAVELVQAAFESSGNRDKILNIFQAKKGMFSEAEPVIFCARH